jgi:hypothetical protein
MRGGLCFLVMLSACVELTPPSAPEVPVTPQSLTGFTQTSGELVGTVTLVDGAGNRRAVTTVDGRYDVDLTGLTLPVLLSLDWSGGQLFSFATASGTANVTVLTDLTVASATTLDPEVLLASPSPAAFETLSEHLLASESALHTGLSSVLRKYGADAPLFRTVLAKAHTGNSLLFDAIAVSRAQGQAVVTLQADGAVLLSAPLSNLSQGVCAGAWTQADALPAMDPDVAVDRQGHGLVVWSQAGATHWEILARWLDGDGTATRVSDGLADGAGPQVCFDAAGDAVVAWAQYDGQHNQVWASRFVPGEGFGAPQHLSTNAGADVLPPDVACAADGDVQVVWPQFSGAVNHVDVWGAAYDADTDTWTPPVRLSDGLNNAGTAHVAMNASGQGAVVWTQQEGDGSVSNGPQDTWARRFSDAGFEPAVQLSRSGAAQAVYGQTAVAVSEVGEIVVAWVQAVTGPFSIWSAHALPGAAWGPPATIANDVQDNCYAPQLTFDGQGVVTAAWVQQIAGGEFIAVNQRSALGAWGTSQAVSDASSQAAAPSVCSDAHGLATVVWYEQGTSTFTVRESHRSPTVRWSAPVTRATLDSASSVSYPVPVVATNPSGQGYLVWGVDSL